MAEDADNDDQWLYGDAPDLPADEDHTTPELDANTEEKLLEGSDDEQQPPQPGDDEAPQEEETPTEPPENDSEPPAPAGVEEAPGEKHNGAKSDEEERNEEMGQNENEEEEDDDSDDDDINVVIGDFKTSPTYAPPMNIKRGGLIATAGDKNKLQQPQTGKFTVDEFEQMGIINGVQAGEFSLDSIEDKPWRKPGSDITDYFNYGFNEDTWKAYCERQKRIRVSESGVGMVPLNSIGMPRGPIPIMNDNSKYSGGFTGIRKAGPPPGRRMTGAIDVIGGGGGPSGPPAGKMDPHQPKENVIQVMTADRREYSRKPPGFPDMSMPPPQTFEEYQPEFGFNPEPEPFYGNYEPTQDLQWAQSNNSWAPNELKPLTGMPPHGPPPGVPPPINQPPPNLPMGMRRLPSADRERIDARPERDDSPVVRESRDRERERDSESRARSEKPKERERDRERDRSHRRDRSRSRSRRHKSRSRSPSHRSHRKKKSRRHEDSEERL